MVVRTSRRLVACLTMLGVLGLALLPAEHIHAAKTEDWDHPLIHRHFDGHDPLDSTARLGTDEDHDEIGWLDSSFITPASGSQVYSASQFLHENLWRAARSRTAATTLLFAPESVHDPPWTTSNGLRAPPSLFV